MKRNKLFLLPLFMLLLAGCRDASSSSAPSTSDSTPPVVSSEPSEDSEDPSSEVDLPISEPVESTSEEEETLPPIITSSEGEEEIDLSKVVSIEAAREMSGKDASVVGVVTSIFDGPSAKKVMTIQEGDFALTLTFLEPARVADLNVGDLIFAKGKINEYNGLIQLENAGGSIVVLPEDPTKVVTPYEVTTYTKAHLTGMDGRWVKVSGLELVTGEESGGGQNKKFTFTLGEGNDPVIAQVSSYLADFTDIVAKLNTVTKFDEVEFEGPLGWFTNPQLNVAFPEMIKITKGEVVGPVEPTKVGFDPESIEIGVGATYESNVVVLPEGAEYDAITYTSSDETVATVSAAGVVTGVEVGSAVITATIGELSGTLSVSVVRSLEGIESVYKLDFSKEEALVAIDKEPEAYYSYANTYNATFKDGELELDWQVRGFNPNNWSVPGVRFFSKDTNPKLDTVITSGLPMDAAKAATLSATFAQSTEPIIGEVNDVLVNVLDIWSSNVTVDKIYLQASADAEFTAPINLGAEDIIKGDILFTFPAVEDHYFRVIFGMVNTTGSNAGIVVSRVDFNTSDFIVDPVEPVDATAIAFDPALIELVVGETYASNLEATPENASLAGVVYTSSDANVATVSASGLVTAVAAGEAVITATLGELSAELEVEVSAVTTVFKLDFSKEEALVAVDKDPGANYGYANTYNATFTDGVNETDWILRGFNPNNWTVAGVRFFSKSTNPKLDTVITSGLPMDAAKAATLAATFAQSKDPIGGEVSEVGVGVLDLWTSGVTFDKIYLQASVDAEFTAPINLGEQEYVKGEEAVFTFDAALDGHYYRVIFGMVNNTTSNTGAIISHIEFR